jgi:hypothetical protein
MADRVSLASENMPVAQLKSGIVIIRYGNGRTVKELSHLNFIHLVVW